MFTKRMFIDAVRQYARHAQIEHRSFSNPVNKLSAMYLAACGDSGMSEAELSKEVGWADAFIEREYAKYDPDHTVPA